MITMSFEERTALLVEREIHWRGDERRRTAGRAAVTGTTAAVTGMVRRIRRLAAATGSTRVTAVAVAVAAVERLLEAALVAR